MILKTTLVILLENYNLEDYEIKDKKTFIFQKLLNLTENLIIIANDNLEETVKFTRIGDKFSFVKIQDKERFFNLKTNFNFEIFIKSSKIENLDDNIIFFNEKCLDFDLEFLNENQLINMMLTYGQNILLSKKSALSEEYKKDEELIMNNLEIDYWGKYFIMENNFFCGRKKIINEFCWVFETFINDVNNGIFLGNESITISLLINKNPKYFYVLYNTSRYNFKEFCFSFISAFKVRHGDSLYDLHENLNEEYQKFNK